MDAYGNPVIGSVQSDGVGDVEPYVGVFALAGLAVVAAYAAGAIEVLLVIDYAALVNLGGAINVALATNTYVS